MTTPDLIRQGVMHSSLLELQRDVLALIGKSKALSEALDDLQQAEAEYRAMHDLYGDAAKATGRAWDLMRRAGDRARSLLNSAVTK